MNFDKSRVYTTLNADELKVGSKVIVEDDLLTLKQSVLTHRLPKVIKEIESEQWEHRFLCDDDFHYSLAYLVAELNKEILKWTDLKIGDVITNGTRVAMVTEIDKDCVDDLYIYAGHRWLNSIELAKWEKVEE